MTCFRVTKEAEKTTIYILFSSFIKMISVVQPAVILGRTLLILSQLLLSD